MKEPTVEPKAFTLVEILVVIILISLLAVFTVPRYIGQAKGAKRNIAKTQIAAIENAIQMFFTNCGRYPTQAEGLRAMIEAPAGLADKWRQPYCKESQLIDPWGNAIIYRRPGGKGADFDIISFGPDGKEGGEGNDADILND